MADLVASNALLHQVANFVVNLLNGNNWLKLYTNNLPPSPANQLSYFLEANFGGYIAQPVSGTFPAPIKAQDGEYASLGPAFVFECTAAPVNMVYGWFISDGVNALLSSPFELPIPVNIGTLFTLQIDLTNWSTFTLSP